MASVFRNVARRGYASAAQAVKVGHESNWEMRDNRNNQEKKDQMEILGNDDVYGC